MPESAPSVVGVAFMVAAVLVGTEVVKPDEISVVGNALCDSEVICVLLDV